jgi:hypothetical protein
MTTSQENAGRGDKGMGKGIITSHGCSLLNWTEHFHYQMSSDGLHFSFKQSHCRFILVLNVVLSWQRSTTVLNSPKSGLLLVLTVEYPFSHKNSSTHYPISGPLYF